ncbi:MAG: acetyl-CoA carboxylase biotin carboxylase subunit [Eubacterium sp.]
MIERILIANRGEIAVRIIRTCKEMGIETVAIYSTADKEALHVQYATKAVCIGGPKSDESYLNMQRILSAACLTGCDAIHPGFGFLSENPQFARLVKQCGLIFIGPDADVIELMGNKARAKETMIAGGVPVIPGSEGVVEETEALNVATKIGFPVLIKARSGGGGRGMRVAEDQASFADAYRAARAEAQAAFGDDGVYVEKVVRNAKHIEVQLMADCFGNVRHLYERDCSMQRRNQKIVEEAPCCCIPKKLRDRMFADAIKACEYVHYNSVGTIEFLWDGGENYYFMEMNTRIQVEHTITEMITGIDLIKQQIKIADHQRCTLTQEEIICRGHAVECRINAEDVTSDFAPRPGHIDFLNLPGGRGVRVDTAIYNGYTIPPYYDSMILKCITYGDTRLEAIKKMRIALEELIIEGIPNNVEFLYLLMHEPLFIKGRFDTGYVGTFIQELKDNGTIV